MNKLLVWFLDVVKLLLFVFVLFFFVKGFLFWNESNQYCTVFSVSNISFVNTSVSGSLSDLHLWLNVSTGFMGLVDVISIPPGKGLVCTYSLW